MNASTAAYDARSASQDSLLRSIPLLLPTAWVPYVASMDALQNTHHPHSLISRGLKAARTFFPFGSVYFGALAASPLAIEPVSKRCGLDPACVQTSVLGLSSMLYSHLGIQAEVNSLASTFNFSASQEQRFCEDISRRQFRLFLHGVGRTFTTQGGLVLLPSLYLSDSSSLASQFGTASGTAVVSFGFQLTFTAEVEEARRYALKRPELGVRTALSQYSFSRLGRCMGWRLLQFNSVPAISELLRWLLFPQDKQTNI